MEHLRATAIPRALRGEVCEPLRSLIFANLQIHYCASGLFDERTGISLREYTCSRHWRTSSPMASFGMRTHSTNSPCEICAGFDERTGHQHTKKEKQDFCPAFCVLVTRTGIEPMFSAWEANVLTAWPTGLALFSLYIILCFFRFVKWF